MKKLFIILFLFFLVSASLFALDIIPPIDGDYFMSSGIGRRSGIGGGEGNFHRGIDIVGPHRCEIRAVADGVVVSHWPAPDGIKWFGHPKLGGMIMIKHDGFYSIYGHLSATYIHEGMKVKQGSVIGRQGATGVVTGEHLHFEIIIDPTLLFQK
jgi:murein DD-endopeptidase MepM/ murein hydrolase activator NlpD